MSARLDFEARLRALRAPKSPASEREEPATAGPSAVSASVIDYGSSGGADQSARDSGADALSWPSVPLAPAAPVSLRRDSFSSRRGSLYGSMVAVDEHGWPAAPNMTVQRTEDGWPEVPGPLRSASPAIHVIGERRTSSVASADKTEVEAEAALPSWLPQSQSQSQSQSQRSYLPPEPEPERYQPLPARSQQSAYQRYEAQQPSLRYNIHGAKTQPPAPSPAQVQEQPSPAQWRETQAPEGRATQAPAQVLGPEYGEAIRVAQRAIESERLRHVHTAIDDYILAGQLLIGIGRQQHQVPHLQDVIKKKALALLQRAEGLAAWTQQVQALDASQQALDAAFEASQASQARALSEQEALVSKMRSDNAEMKQHLNQLVVLTKMRTRLRRVVRDRRARKQAEAAAAAAASGDPTALLSPSFGPDLNDVEGMSDEEGARSVDQWYDGSGSALADDGDDDESSHLVLPSTVASLRQSESRASSTPSSKDEQKVMLVNELHSAIGLPEIDHLRTFKPLSADPTGDARQEELRQELERARREAEELRASVQSMERCLRLAAQHSKARSIKMEQEKQEDLARVRQELEFVREQLERERRMSSASSMDSRRSSVHSNAGDREDTESSESVRGLRSSLLKVFSRKKSRESLGGSGDAIVDDGGRNRSVAQRASEEQSSPRHRAVSSASKQRVQRQEQHQFDSDSDDGGVWL